ncbi:MAG: extracellular solute-binding protein [Clostridia bacterium]|nr:extracellular solute-binding protein [Clostridia bacterium]
MKYTRVLALLVALLLVVAMVPAMAEETITLTWVGAGWAQNDKAARCIAKWEELHPNIKVEYIDQGSLVDTAYLVNLDTMISSGEVIDVTYLGYTDVYSRVMNGGALPLDEYIAAAGDDYDALYGSVSTAMLDYEGSIYGVPYSGNTFKVFYNKTMVEAAGIEIPETWTIEEFTEIAQQLNDPENGVYGVCFPYGWTDIIHAPAMTAGWSMVKYDEAGNVVPNFDDEIFKTCMTWAKDLASEYGVCPDIATLEAESINRRQTLVTGRSAMIVDGPYTLVWLQNYMFNDPGEGPIDFELGVANLPYITEEAAEISYNTLVGAFYIPKTAKYPAEAYEFAKFVCNECPQESACYMPMYLDADMEAATTAFTDYIDANGEVHTEIYPVETAVAAVATPYESHIGHYGYDPSLAPYNSLMATLLDEQYKLYLNGEMDLEDWVAMMQELGAAEIANAN